jgi:hypothetical protein
MTNTQTGDVLKYDGTKWVNSTINTTDLTDVNQTNINTNTILKYDGSEY